MTHFRYADSRQVVSWVLGLGERARILGPPELAEEAAERLALIVERHENALEPAPASRAKRPEPQRDPGQFGLFNQEGVE